MSINKYHLTSYKQSGTALITVILISAVMVIMVTESVKSVKFQKQLSSNLINKDQAYSYLMGMEELAKILLKRAFDNEKEDIVNLGQPWAKDDIVFPIDGGVMKASVKDMQGCFNLNSIASITHNQNSNNSNPNNPNQNSQANLNNVNTTSSNSFQNNSNNFGPAAETIGQNIFEELIRKVSEDNSTPKALAAATRDWIDEDIDPAGPDGTEDDYYQSLSTPYRTANSAIAHTSELRAIKNFNQDLYYRLLPHVCVLPDKEINQININTIDEDSAVLIYAILDSNSIDLENVRSAISNRGDNGYETVEEFLNELSVTEKQIKNKNLLTVKSNYFQVDSIAEIGREGDKTIVAMKTLFERDDNNKFKIVSRYFGKK